MNIKNIKKDEIKVIETFQPIRQTARDIRNSLVKENNWNIKSDLRINSFEQIDNLIQSLNLSIAFTIRSFSEEKWIDNLLFNNLNLIKMKKIKI